VKIENKVHFLNSPRWKLKTKCVIPIHLVENSE